MVETRLTAAAFRTWALRYERYYIKDVAHTRYAGNRIRDGIEARYASLYVLWG